MHHWQPTNDSMSSCFESEIEKLAAPLYRYAIALSGSQADADDLLQETFLKILKMQDRFEQIENKRAWTFAVMTNIFRDNHRWQSRRPTTGPLSFDPQNGTGSKEQDREGQSEQVARAMSFFQRLPDRQRQVMFLRCIEEYSINQIAKTLSTTENNVKASLSIARKKVRQMMQDDQKVIEQ